MRASPADISAGDVPAARDLDQLARRASTSSIAAGDRFGEHARALAAQQQHRAADAIPRVPEEEPRGERHRLRHARDRRVEVQAVTPILPCASRAARAGATAASLIAPHSAWVWRRWASTSASEAKRLGRLEVARDRLQRVHRDVGADVVHHQPADRARRLRGDHHAEQPAHGRADPLDLLQLEVCEQRVDVGDELAEVVSDRRSAARRCAPRPATSMQMTRAPSATSARARKSKSRALPL